MFFTLPWMLLGLLGLPLLAGIYWLRSRSRPRVVSSLFLWIDQRNPREGGRLIEKIQTPLTFFLELIALAAIALAAALPGFIRPQYARPLVLVLDNSYSMQAGEEKSVRQQAEQALQDEIGRHRYVVRVILAGKDPHLLSAVVRNRDELTQPLQEWTCQAPIASLEASLALASEIGGETARILVLTDHPPTEELKSTAIQWWSLGTPKENLALTAASRDSIDQGTGEQGDRVLLEVTNFSNHPARTHLRLAADKGPTTSPQPLEIAAGAAHRLMLTLPQNAGTLQATLDANDLKIDNEVFLVSPRKRALRVQIALPEGDSQTSLRNLVARALEATGQTVLVDSRPDLLITDRSLEPEGTAHRWEILGGSDPVSYDGPFVLDRNHPLTQGLSLDAVIWSAPKEPAFNSIPVITAGNRILLTDQETITGSHVLQMLFIPELSTLTQSPDWPILVTNLVRWCLTSLPGPGTVNVRLEQPLTVMLSEDALTAPEAVVIAPDKSTHSFPVHGKALELVGRQPGLHQVRIGPMEFQFACNALNSDESNLTGCEPGKWGEWQTSQFYQDQQINLDWVCILVALTCLMLELMILYREGVTGS